MMFAVPSVLHFQSVWSVGKRLPIVYLHLEPVMIFAVPMIHGEMFAHDLLSFFEEREHV